MSNKTDLVMGELLAACKRRASKEMKEERAKLRAQLVSQKKKISTLEAEIKKYKEGDKSHKVREKEFQSRETKIAKGWKDLKIASRKVLRTMERIEKVKDKKIRHFLGSEGNWRRSHIDSAAVRSVKEIAKNKDKIPPKASKNNTNQRRRRRRIRRRW